MADYEIYAGKGMADVKTTYLRHTYTWSDHSITGEKLGWGITASSAPEDPRLLRELEKLALAALPDYRSRIPVEMLLYSPVCGYVKMTVMPRKAGNAGRKNKMVRLYQLASVPLTPADYLSPGDYWGPARKGVELEPLTLDVEPWALEDLKDRIGPAKSREERARLVELVYRTLAGDLRQLNLVAPDWKPEEFSEKARYVMFLIHEMVPEILRKKAGYLSFARDKIKHIPFVFSSRPIGKNVYFIGEEGTGPVGDQEELSPFLRAFFNGIGEDFFDNREFFEEFLAKSNDLLAARTGSRRALPCLAYLYLSLPGHGGRMPAFEEIQDRIPELLYWGASDPAFAGIADRILASFHKDSYGKDETVRYIQTLVKGCTERSMEGTAREIRWVLDRTECSKEEAGDLMEEIQDRWEPLYLSLGEEGAVRTESKRPKKRALPHTDTYVDPEDEDSGSGGLKGDRSEEIPKPFVEAGEVPREEGQPVEGQPEEGQSGENQPAEGQAEDRPGSRVRGQDKGGREGQKRPAKGGGSSLEKDLEGKNSRIAQIRAVEDGMEDSLTFLITGIVQGFVTGCMLYLAHYTMKLGHWKIAVGLLGVWIPIMVNYWYILRQKGEWRPLWKIWGLCLTEGLIIEIAAWFFPTQKMRLIFFVVLGIGVLLVQVVGMIRLARNNKNTREGENTWH